MNDDPELLRRFANERAQDAFAELVRRHVDLVYAVALRQVGGDAHLAQDVAQAVFAALARKAGALATRGSVAGWLYRATQFAAIDVVRAERRRRVRERLAMNEILTGADAAGGTEDWEALRPLLDRLIAELGNVDREAVVLRFVRGCSFAEVGAQLRLSENAARMRVERALGKLHAMLTKRGVRSTAAALATAIGAQAKVLVPGGLPAALASGAVMATATVGAGAFAVFAPGKLVVVAAGVVAMAAIGVVAVQRGEMRAARALLSDAQRQRVAAEMRVTELNARVAQAEQRAAEAERDNGELLKAVEAARAMRAAQVGAAAQSKAGDDERLARERAYQQELAAQRAQEAIAQAQVSSDAAQRGGVQHYERLIEAAREHLANARFRMGIRAFNEAMANKPADATVTPEVRELQATLTAQNTPVELALTSDGETFVSIMGARSPTKFTHTTVRILPGDYEIVGRRSGHTDVTIPVKIRHGTPLAPIHVACAERR